MRCFIIFKEYISKLLLSFIILISLHLLLNPIFANNTDIFSSYKYRYCKKDSIFNTDYPFIINHLNAIDKNKRYFYNYKKNTFFQTHLSTNMLKSIYHTVPFIPQAPYGNWNDRRQSSACEESSALMAIKWSYNAKLSKNEALARIIDIAKFEEKNYGSYYDTSAEDTKKRIFNEYFNYYNVRVKNAANPELIIKELNKNRIVIVPVNGQKLDNPYFTPPGPERHMLVIKGWDNYSQNFITNDPGTRRGRDFTYHRDNLFSAIRDYKSGYKLPISKSNKVMIIVEKSCYQNY